MNLHVGMSNSLHLVTTLVVAVDNITEISLYVCMCVGAYVHPNPYQALYISSDRVIDEGVFRYVLQAAAEHTVMYKLTE